MTTRMHNMMPTGESQRTAEIRSAIREILFRDWDPLQVNANPALVDEYDSYVAPVYREITGNRSADYLVKFLATTELALGGAGGHTPAKLHGIATKLLAIDVSQ